MSYTPTTIDPAAHLDLATLERRFERMPAAPRRRGTVTLLVARGPDETRRTPDRVLLTAAAGMPGDRWSAGQAPKLDAQLAVQQTSVSRMIAGGQPLSLFGDNLTVDIDLSDANMPVGSRVRVGAAVCVVTPMPHLGCAKYAARFGHDALRFISRRELRPLRLRGLYLRVQQDGEVAVGDPIEVLVLGSASGG